MAVPLVGMAVALIRTGIGPPLTSSFLRLSPVYKWAYGTITTDSFVSIEKAEQVLGFKPRYSNQQALVRNYRWYIEHLSQFEHASGVSHRVPWKQGILKLAKAFF